jgi:hypothetical protein
MNIFVKVSASFVLGMTYTSLSAHASLLKAPQMSSSQYRTTIAAEDQSALIAANKTLLVNNRALARKIAAKLGITSTGELPTSGTPLEQNQVIILQNQKTFRDIAEKVGASAAPMSEVNASDPAEKNHQLLLVNKGIVVSILKKLGITPTPPVLKGTFVEKNNTLLKANAAALAKIAAKLDVK